MTTNAHSPETRAAAVADYVTGMTMDEVAAKHGTSATSVWNWLKAADVPRRPAATVKRPPCTYEECGAPHHAHGYCHVHYDRVYLARKPVFDAAARIENCRFMADTGESLTGAAARLGITTSALESWLARNDHPTLLILAARDRMPVESQASFHGAGLRVSA